ncbi:MAG TPA: helix-turn-helix transcriptional regulator [Pseudonocardiaceae bacterium]|nr:helix-turn-helix transcriptional regulator [Pseudonocardiaceae bacterium]
MTAPTELSELDMHLVKFVAAGMTYDAIAHLLHVSAKTAKNHLSSLRIQMGAKNNAHLVAIAFHRGILRGKS